MKQVNGIFLALCLMVSTTVFAQDVPGEMIISPADTTVESGASVNYVAVVTDTGGAVIDTTIDWSVTGDVGTIDENGVFTAITGGSGFIVGRLGDITDTASVTVTVQPDPDPVPDVALETLEVTPGDTTILVADSVQFSVVVTDTNGAVVDTAVTWSVVGNIGTIDSTGLFIADSIGSGTIVAQIGDLTDSVNVTVEAAEEPVADLIGTIEISPSEAGLSAGDSLQFAAEVKDTSGVELDTTVVWAISDEAVGTLDSVGLFIAVGAGEATITATVGSVTDSVTVSVTEDEEPPAGVGGNSIAFYRVKSDGKITKFGGSVTEGGTKTLGGMPSPMNFLNGGKLTFPENSLSEDVTIHINLPAFGKIDGNDITFGDSIVSAVTFDVLVGDSVVSPYVFDEPLTLTLPYKQGLLNNLGIDPQDLSMYYVSEEGELVSAGITNVVLDEGANTITANVEHFSDLALGKGAGTAADSGVVLQAVALTPGDTTLEVGGTLQLTAIVTDTNGAVVDTSVAWTGVGDIGTVDEAGLFTATTAGEGGVEVSVGELVDTVLIIVTEVETPAGIEIAGIVVSPADTQIVAGTTVQYVAMVTDTSGVVVDTSVTWSVVDSVGTIDENGLFTGTLFGQGQVVAQIGTLTDSATVTVIEIIVPVEEVIGSVEVTPEESGLAVGDSLLFSVEVKDTAGVELDTLVQWSITDESVGTVDSAGLFVAVAAGEANVIATVGSVTDTVFVSVTDDEIPPVGDGNVVAFRRVLPNGNDNKFGGNVTEGGSKTLGGMPSPMNFLNGGKLEFPENSLSDDITIYIKLPQFAKVQGNDVSFGDSILAAVSFEVHVGDSVVSPFVFDEPLRLTLPFKHGLLANLGIEPADLGMFFATDSGALDSTGITDIQVDEAGNSISALVHHFSDLAVAPKAFGRAIEQPALLSRAGGRIDVSSLPHLGSIGLNNLFINVPDGALNDQVQMRIQAPTTIPAAQQALQAVEFTIEGHSGQFNFGQPVTIGIPYPDSVQNPLLLTMQLWDSVAETWNPIDLVNSIGVDTLAKVVTAQVAHFSIYGIMESQVPTGIDDLTDNAEVPEEFTLSANYPNPFNPATNIRYSLPQGTNVRLTVFNLLGQMVTTLVDETQSAGQYVVRWNGADLSGRQMPSGMYFYRLETTAGFMQTRKMLMLK